MLIFSRGYTNWAHDSAWWCLIYCPSRCCSEVYNKCAPKAHHNRNYWQQQMLSLHQISIYKQLLHVTCFQYSDRSHTEVKSKGQVSGEWGTRSEQQYFYLYRLGLETQPVQLISREKMEVNSLLLEEDPCCSACGEVFSVPVVLCCISCGCSFCEICCQQFWETQCPFCRQEATGSHLRKCREQRIKVLNTAQLNDRDIRKPASYLSLPCRAMHENNQ